VDNDAVRAVARRLARTHPFGGQVIERAAIVAEGSDAAAVIACIVTRARGAPNERRASANSDQGLHACRLSRRG
jgi:hypothetical protein